MKNVMLKTPLEGAILLLDKGYKVFPLAPNSKVPPKGLHWKEWALDCDLKKINDYNTANPNCNWGVSCDPSGLAVVDIDNGTDKNGFESMKNLPAFEKTFRAKTPSGGIHLYYKGRIKTSASDIAIGIDTRGIGGYVVAPGSVINGHHYYIEQNIIAAELPTWIVNKLQEKKLSLVKPTDDNIHGSITEGSRDSEMTQWAGMLRAAGLGYDEILGALLPMNEIRCNPPLDENDLMRIARSVSRYERGHASAIADFAQLDETVHRIIRGSDIVEQDQAKRDWIMYGRYIGSFLSMIIAPGSAGKSMLTMLDAVSLATGRELTGSKIVKPCNVWLHNAEDPMSELKGRILAIAKEYNIPVKALHKLIMTSGRTTKITLVGKIKNKVTKNVDTIAWVKKFITDNEIKVAIFDPFIGMHKLDENSNNEMDEVVDILREIAEETKCSICIVHHSNKSVYSSDPGSANSSRGASAIINAARIAQTITPMSKDDAKRFGIDEDEKGWYVRLDDAKANLQPPADKAIWFKKESVKLTNGDSYGTLAIEVLNDCRAEQKALAKEATTKDVLKAIALSMSDTNKVSVSLLAKKIRGDKDTDAILSKKALPTLIKHIKSALEAEYVLGQDTYSIENGEYNGKPAIYVTKEDKQSSFLD